MATLAEADHVRVERADDVVTVTLCDPDHRNAQTPATWRQLAAVPGLLIPSDRAVLLRGEGRSFSAGMDRRMFAEGVPGEESLGTLAGRPADEIDGFIRQAQSAFTWCRRVPPVTIALVQGHAIGAGFQLALGCDLMVVADDAQLAMRETSWGLVPDLGGTAPLVAAVGYSRALEICATGRFVGADEAVRIGIAVAQVPSADWDDALAGLLGPVRQAPQGAVAELKWLLDGAASAVDQLARERAAQVRRLVALRGDAAGA